jgi:hypothetical protein
VVQRTRLAHHVKCHCCGLSGAWGGHSRSGWLVFLHSQNEPKPRQPCLWRYCHRTTANLRLDFKTHLQRVRLSNHRRDWKAELVRIDAPRTLRLTLSARLSPSMSGVLIQNSGIIPLIPDRYCSSS